MILYFTGTGNSRHIANRIAAATGDTVTDIGARIKAGDTSAVVTTAKRFSSRRHTHGGYRRSLRTGYAQSILTVLKRHGSLWTAAVR